MFAVKLMVLLWVIIVFSLILIRAWVRSMNAEDKLKIAFGNGPKSYERVILGWGLLVMVNMILTVWSLIYFLFLR